MTCPHPEKMSHIRIGGAFAQLWSLEHDGKGDGQTWPYLCCPGEPNAHWHLGHHRSTVKMREAYEAWKKLHPSGARGKGYDGYTRNPKAINRRLRAALRRKR